jgi:Ca2+-binding EF-hand superfamily protein
MTKEDFEAKTRSKFARWDANSDGTVTAEEVAAIIERRMERRHHRRGGGRMQRMLRRLDADRDGKVTKAEVEAGVTERFARMDLDGDGVITDADLPPIMRGQNVLSGEGRFGRRGHGGRRMGRMLRRLIGADANKDGTISLQEAQDHAAKRFARFDRNQDGAIDPADQDMLRKEMLDYRVKRFMHRYGAAQSGKLTLEQFTEHRNKRFARRDVDGDGTIEREEMRGGRRGHHRWGRDRDERRGGERGGRGGPDREDREERDNQ